MPLTVTAALQELRTDLRFAQHIVCWQIVPARAGRYAPIPSGLDERVVELLERRGIARLYVHQSEAISAALRGEDIAVVTGAASGKTLCYNLPVLSHLWREEPPEGPQPRALYVFPTKALAQDQLACWRELTKECEVRIAADTYDGDTPAAARARIRQTVRLLITNPDMLHAGILPHHTRWRSFLAGLRYIVVDEMHAYRGVFGSHVANVLRRLRRVCELYGARPTFICCSATIANPAELARQLVGRSVTIVDDDGSPRGERHFIFYNPPLVDSAHGVRRSVLLESASLADFFLACDLPTIVFHGSRRGTELLLRYLRDRLARRGESPQRVRGYRGGYLPDERRSIESALRRGSVRGVVTTNALELGVDIGELAVCILAGYPGTIASTWQQAGRAGRRQGVSIVVLVAGPSALDQYLVAHPQFFFGRTPEAALLAPDNPFLLRSHLKCAAFEYPVAHCEPFSPLMDTEPLLEQLAAQEGVLHSTATGWHWMSSRYPAQDLSLRTTSPDRFTIVTGGEQVVGQVDAGAALQLIHPGAVYLHEGTTYLVDELDWAKRIARVAPTEAPYFTEVSISAKVEVLEVLDSLRTGAAYRSHGKVRVCTRATSFRQIAWHTHEILATLPLDLPEQELLTTAYWLHLDAGVVNALRDLGDWTIAPIISYGPNWAEQRRRARERDRFLCRNCGLPEPPGQEHDVHHVRPFRTFDYRPGLNDHYLAANDLANLMTLCPECHRRLETARHVQGTLEGLAHVLRSLAPLHLMCEPRDLGVAADLDFPLTRRPTVVLYDAVPGGIGFSQALFAVHQTLLQECLEWVSQCPCKEGCPACVGPSNEPGMGAKERVKHLLRAIVQDTLATTQ